MPSAYYKMLTTYLPSIVFFGLSFLCLPFLTEGYFFLLDGGLFSTPAISFSFLQFFDQSLFYFLGLFKLLSFVFPTWILQRCLYIGMLFLLGFIGYKLIERHTKIGGYFAGILMMFNPFVYARFLDGQITVIAGIVFLLISWHFLLLWMREMDGVSGRWAAVFSGIAIMWTQHAIFFVFVGLLIFLGLLFIQTKNFKKIGKYFLIFTWITLLLNVHWIFWSIFQKSEVSRKITAVSSHHLQAFATYEGGVGIYFHPLSLHGFWGEREGRFAQTYVDNPYWQYLFGIIFLLVIIGVWIRFSQKDRKFIFIESGFLIIGIIAYVLSLGIAKENIFAPLNQFLYDYIPFYLGFREPQKWTGILLISYAYFWGHGVGWIISQNIKEGVRIIFGSILLLIPMLYTPTMFFGFKGQITPSDYYSEWYEQEKKWKNEKSIQGNTSVKMLSCDAYKSGISSGCYDTISFPWHMYMQFGFARTITINYGKNFFTSTRLLQGDNMEIGAIYTEDIRPESRIIEKYIGPNGVFLDTITEVEAEEFRLQLLGLWIREILLLKESNYMLYYYFLSRLSVMGKITQEENNKHIATWRIN